MITTTRGIKIKTPVSKLLPNQFNEDYGGMGSDTRIYKNSPGFQRSHICKPRAG